MRGEQAPKWRARIWPFGHGRARANARRDLLPKQSTEPRSPSHITLYESPPARQLDPEQAEVVLAPPTARILVSAEPGTGKTYVLISRLTELIARYGLSPGREVLTLSFSRAAVYEIRRRIAATGSDARYVRAITFDSLATRLLSEVDPDGLWIRAGYDERIRAATARIRADPEARGIVGGHENILVDEIQDLVADRAEFVQAILEACSGGFTLLGDPAQGIYNWHLEGEARSIRSGAMYSWLRQRFAPELVERTLSKNYRARSESVWAVWPLGEALRSPAPDYKGTWTRLTSQVDALPKVGVENLGALANTSGQTAILCRTNMQVLAISRALRERGVSHVVRHNATDRVLPVWVGATLGGLDQRSIGKAAFLDHAIRFWGASSLDPEEAWSALKSIEGQLSDTLDLGLIEERVRIGRVPAELFDAPAASLIVSTIHRAKGLEFDRVLVVDDGRTANSSYAVEMAEEARVLYVALTRAKRELYTITGLDMSGLSKEQKTKRIVRFDPLRTLVDLEVQAIDIHSGDPAGGYVLDQCDSARTQAYLRDHVRPGDPVTLTLVKTATAGQGSAHYAIAHEGTTIGVTAESFSHLLLRVLASGAHRGGAKPRWIEHLNVEVVDTVAGTAATARRCGLGASGLWLRARVSGLGRLRYA